MGQTPAAAPEASVVPEAAAKSGAKKSFLGFRLPSRAFAFDQRQSYEVVPELSRVGFDAKSTLHDFSGVTSNVRGAFAANLADPKDGWAGYVECEASTLVTGVEGRDEAMLEHLDAKEHATIRYELQGFACEPDGIDRAQQAVAGVVTGLMRIRGKERPLSVPVKITVDASRRVQIEGQAKVHLPDFEVPVPSQLGLIRMEDDVVVWLSLRARVAAAGVDNGR